MNNDLISRSHFDDRVRLAAGPDADEEFSADFLDGVKTILYMLSTEPAVPQEMSAKELLHAERRMYNEDSDAYLEYSSLVIEEEMESALCYIEAWAREHPEKPEKRRKTYAEDFKERCPNHLHNCGMPIVCRNEVYGFGGRCTVEEAVKRGGCSSCWNAEMEGEDDRL